MKSNKSINFLFRLFKWAIKQPHLLNLPFLYGVTKQVSVMVYVLKH